MKRSRTRLNSAGFTIAELMIAVALSTIVMGSVISLMRMTQSQLRDANAKLGVMGVTREIRDALSSINLCTQTLQGQIFDPDPKQSSSIKINLPQSTIIVGPGTVHPRDHFYVKNLYFSGAAPAGTSVSRHPLFTANLYLTPFVYDGKTPDDPRYGGTALAPILIGNYSIEVGSNAHGSPILGCANTPNLDVICAGLGGALNADGKCKIKVDYANVCATFGGLWNGTKCALNPGDTPAEKCAAVGGAWDGTTCTPSKAAAGADACPNTEFASYFDYSAYLTCLTAMVDCHKAADAVGATPNGQTVFYVTDPDVRPVSACARQCISGTWTAASCQVIEATQN